MSSLCLYQCTLLSKRACLPTEHGKLFYCKKVSMEDQNSWFWKVLKNPRSLILKARFFIFKIKKLKLKNIYFCKPNFLNSKLSVYTLILSGIASIGGVTRCFHWLQHLRPSRQTSSGAIETSKQSKRRARRI